MKLHLRSLSVAIGFVMSALVVVGPTAPVEAFEELQPLTAISPVRVLDTRIGVGADAASVGPDETITLDLSEADGLPSNVRGVVINITTTRSTEPSFITVWPSGSDRPSTSNLNTEPGQDTPNLVIVDLSPDRTIDLYNAAGSVHLVADVTAYFSFGPSIETTAPTRVLDSRDGTGTLPSPFGPNETRRLGIAGVAGVESDATAVVLNVTSTRSTEPSFITVWPSGSDRPLASTLNTEPGQNTPNLAIVELGADGAIDIFNEAGSTDVIADVVGFLRPSSLVDTTTPARFLDTRSGTGTSGQRRPVGAEEHIDLQVAGIGDVPDNATAVIVNVTSVASTQPSYVTVWPTGSPQPTASTLNTEVGQATPNLAVVKIGDGGKISLFNRFGSTHLIVDVAGWYLPSTALPLVDDLDFFRGEGFRSTADFGLSRASAWRFNTNSRVIEASTTAGVFATGENFHAYARIYTPFQARRADAELSYDIDWSGTMTAFVGADAAAEVWVRVRVYEIIVNNNGGPAGRGDVVWERELENSGVGAALQAISVDQVVGSARNTVRLPRLEAGRSYRVEAEVYCNTRVIFSVGATSCDFRTGDRGATVNDWAIEYAPTT